MMGVFGNICRVDLVGLNVNRNKSQGPQFIQALLILDYLFIPPGLHPSPSPPRLQRPLSPPIRRVFPVVIPFRPPTCGEHVTTNC